MNPIYYTSGGTQTSAGKGYNEPTSGSFGYAYQGDTSKGYGAGGGSGWYGGGRGWGVGGGGGSSYVSGHGGCPKTLSYGGKTYTFSNPEVWDGLGYKWNNSAATSTHGFPNTAGTGNENGHSGDGYAKITMVTPDAD